MLSFTAVDSHTEGMPTRVITGGAGELPGETMLQRKLRFESERDEIRRLLMREPRGHAAMSGAILQRPTRPEADWGVVFIEVSGCLPMCGHGTIGVAAVLVQEGLVAVTEPETVITLDVPAGLVQARVRVVDGRARSVTLRNVPAYAHELGARAGSIDYDMAFGGNFYAIADAAQAGLTVAPDRAGELIAAGLELMAAVPEPVHPVDPEIRGCHHVIWTGPPSDGADRARGDRDPSRLGRSLAVWHWHERADGGAARARRAGPGRRVRARVDHRHPLHRPAAGRDLGRRPASGRPRDHRPRLGYRPRRVRARSDRSVPGGLCGWLT